MDDWAATFSKSVIKILFYQVWAETMNMGLKPLWIVTCSLVQTKLLTYLHWMCALEYKKATILNYEAMKHKAEL